MAAVQATEDEMSKAYDEGYIHQFQPEPIQKIH